MKTKLLLILLLLPALGFAQTYTYTTLVSFPNSSKKSAVNPFAPTIDVMGNIYGISYYGGANNGGTVFKVTPAGSMSVLYSFAYRTFPYGSLVRDPAGNLYGITQFGGTYDAGMIFKVTPAGKMINLYNFSGAGGGSPLARDTAGNLYGYDYSGKPSLYRLTPSGVYSILYTFCSLSACADGDGPAGGPILKPDGNLYGVTAAGGTLGYGTVFKVTPEGQEAVLYNFLGGTDASSGSKLTQDAAGNLYGTSYYGGANNNGTVFNLTSSGVESVVYDFCSLTDCADGRYPNGPVIVDAAGNVYGIASEGGTSDFGPGTAYKIAASRQYSVIHDAGGAGLGYALAMDKSGNLYGMTWNGGGPHNGTVYKLTKH